MKTFQHYLMESRRTFDYRIKIVGDVTADVMKRFREQLKKFDPESIGDDRKTPVMSRPTDFPEFPNESVTMLDASFRYPATPPQIEQIARLLGIDPDRICIHQRDYDEAMDRELLGIDQQRDLLVNTDLPAPDKQQKELSRDYAAVGADKQVVKNSAEDATWTVAGGKTPPAETTNDLPMGVRSPMTTIKRPPRPATGFRT
jgi:hypothetical protein